MTVECWRIETEGFVDDGLEIREIGDDGVKGHIFFVSEPATDFIFGFLVAVRMDKEKICSDCDERSCCFASRTDE